MLTLKKWGLMGVLLTLSLGLMACGADEPDPPLQELEFESPGDLSANEPGTINADGVLELTLEELAYYDGTDGKKAYVAVDGNIYDMSDSARWRGGNHNGNQAGQDLTAVIDGQSPHGRSTLTRVPKVGILVDPEGS